MWNKQGAVVPERTWGPLIFILKFKFLKYKQSIGKVRQKSQCRFYFSGMTLKCIWSNFFFFCIILLFFLTKIYSHVFSAENYAIFVKKWSADWDEFYCPISSCDVVLWTDLITKKGFWGKTTCRAILNWVLSLNL